MLDALAPLWNADRHTISTLRAWCDPLNGAPAPEPAQPSAESLERLLRQVTILRKQNGVETLVPEPATLGAWGAVVAGQRHSEETLKFAVATAALKHGAVLTPFRSARNRRIVWEIGGGWGGFAFHFKTLCPNVTYVITGLPDRLLVSAVYLMTVFPDARWRLQGESDADDTWSDWEHLDFLFVDTHPGMNEETLMSVAISDWLILILRPDRQDYLGTAVTIEVSRKLGVPNLILVVNKALASMDQAALRKDVERSFAAELGAVLLLSEDMLRLGSAGIFALKFPDHQFTRAVAGLAARIVGGK